MFKKFLFLIFCLLVFQIETFATELSNSVNNILNSFDFERDSVVSISLKDGSTKLPLYEKNAYKFLNPASVLKIFTMAASLDTLGRDYTFNTTFYKDKSNNLYLKLSGDPLFTSSDLDELVKKLKSEHKRKINEIYIDDSITDMIPYPNGWAADDFWPNSPKLSPYMIDKNTVKIDIYIDTEKNETRIIQKDPYKFIFINKLLIGDTNKIDFLIDDIHNTVNIEGTISKNIIGKEIPVLNPKYFFCNKLHNAFNKNGIRHTKKFLFKKVPSNVQEIAKFERPIDDIIKHVLITSDNTSAEMVFKVAGAKYAKENSPVETDIYTLGTNQNAINMFYDFYKNLGLDILEVKIVDGSGVSRYNAMNTNWMTNALMALDFDYEKYLPTADVGTLNKRMRELKEKVYFKTGTLNGMSSLAGVINIDNKKYYYSSVILSFNRNKSLIKGVEDEIIYEIYRALNNE